MLDKKSATFFGPHGAMTHVIGNTAFVSDTDKKDGVYTKRGNSIIGPDGIYSVMGVGDNQTIAGPDGVSTLINNGSTSTIVGPDGMHAIFHNSSGGGTVI